MTNFFSDGYKKYLADEMRRAFGYEGCPIILVPKARPKTVEPVRKFKTARNSRKQDKESSHRFHRKHR